MESVENNKIPLHAYKKLFDSFYASLCLFSSNFTNDLELSKDLVQEVFIKIWNKQNLEWKNEDCVKSYLYVAVRNKSLDAIKNKEFRSKTRLKEEDLKILTSQSYFEKEVVIEETSRLVKKAINTLPYKCKRIINLSLNGWGNQQISEELSISLNTVKTQKRIAYQKLRPILKGTFFFAIQFLMSLSI